ncbi:MAG: bifunctional phosphoribosylaminoimidazolecarboxamide formyltransferase/IMP cyclohydrolase [Planctomycetes bacterium]|nr:bifunctional phosphoribosylaminoimidazolecarboxamide formyltransferase/IMP cyclohydrolase [Planctomycetota bacterium]
MTPRTIRRALLSVSDKTGLVDFAKVLASFGVELISTGGTRKALADAGLKVLDISEITGFPEMLDGRVKTLHPRVHGGILYVRGKDEHETTIKEHKIAPIDMVVCNLYPFEATVMKPGATHEEIIENIDIGGPSMVRSASKNYHDVAILTAPWQYDLSAAELKANHGALGLPTRERLAGAAFALTAVYDTAIAGYFARSEPEALAKDRMPFANASGSDLVLRFHHKRNLRYGENPHQPAAFYVEPNVKHACVASAEVLGGKELSYNNILDLDSAFNLVREFTEPAAVVVKHNNPCGAATAATLVDAFAHAYEGDPVSAFGGILGFNREVDEATAMRITEPNRFIECIIAPGYSKAAYEVLTTRPKWKASVRLLKTPGIGVRGDPDRELDFRRVDGGLLVQNRDAEANDFAKAEAKTKRAPTDAELADLKFAWIVAKHVKSNAIVLGKNRMIVGVGAGQMSRIDSTHMAIRKAGDRVKGSVLASDAFFPFRDNIDMAAAAGVTAIVQPGGSVRDQDSIDACNEHGIAMIFTGARHFRH